MSPHDLDRGEATPCDRCRSEHDPASPCRHAPMLPMALMLSSAVLLVSAVLVWLTLR